MGKINFLSEAICNRIAAGEVIDRPYSVVKEMIENSIDAGATEIEIYIERGGKDMIKVVDNGCGIEKDDMRAAFFAHATSKIKDLEDIDHIHTLGFRGEALATISSVALVELVSAVEGKEGNRVECDGEFIGKVQPAVSGNGTEITVRNLFFNTPVRFKFMRSDKKEESDITTFVTRYILGNPAISFKYYIDGKLTLQSYGGGLEEAIAQVYGANVLPNCFKINVERNGLHLSGFISNQSFFKPNKTYQNLYLNGRCISNPVIMSAISNAYAPYTVKRNHPFYTLFLEMSDDMVDVNVHPNKSDVRFVDNSLIYGTIYKIISSILDGTSKAADFVVQSSVVPEMKSTFSDKARQTSIYSAEYNIVENVKDKDFSDVVGIEKYLKPAAKDIKIEKKSEEKQDFSVYENYQAPDKSSFDRKNYKFTIPSDNEILKNDKMQFHDDMHDLSLESEVNKMVKRWKVEQEQIEFANCKYRGVLFNTYLLYEIKNEVYIIDQHAAHERLLYDDLCLKLKDRSLARQGMLIPYLFSVTAEEHDFIEENLEAIMRLGFTVEPVSPLAYKIGDVPVDLPNLDVKGFFDEVLANVGKLKNLELKDIVKDKIAQTACKHAVKGGDALTDLERDKLFSMLKGNLGLKCPHGRPICVKLTKDALEKMFLRKL